MEPAAYVEMGGGTSLNTVPLCCDEGVHQGAVESGWFFSLTCNTAFQSLNNTLTTNGGTVMAIIDDNYLLGNMNHIFASNKTFAEELDKVDYSSNLQNQSASLKRH